MMKKITISLLLIPAMALCIFSCKKAEQENIYSSAADYPGRTGNAGINKVGDPVDSTVVCPPVSVTLMAGQTINAGQVTVSSDAAYIYVTYSTANGYTLTQTHLYVGNCATIPVNTPGNPIPGQFPYGGMHSNISTYTYQVPISVLNGESCGCIAAHAVVEKLDASGHVIDQQTGWGDGIRINLTGGNWGMKFNYCLCQ